MNNFVIKIKEVESFSIIFLSINLKLFHNGYYMKENIHLDNTKVSAIDFYVKGLIINRFVSEGNLIFYTKEFKISYK